MDITNLRLLYNAAAHFAAAERYPDGLIGAIAQEGVAGFDALCWALAELATQGELARRDMGYDKEPILTEPQARLRLRPLDIAPAKTAVMQAVIEGIKPPDAGEGEEVNEVLMEHQKKTENG